MSSSTTGLTLLVLCAWIEGASQICFKQAVHCPQRKALWVGIGSVVHLVEAVLYTAVLALIDLSIAYPLSGLVFVTTMCLSAWILREVVTPTRWIGAMLILAGAGLLASAA